MSWFIIEKNGKVPTDVERNYRWDDDELKELVRTAKNNYVLCDLRTGGRRIIRKRKK